MGEARLTFDLETGEHRLGSSPENDIHLPFRGVSREHALLVLSQEGLTVEDRGSRNGTFVNRSRVERSAVETGAEIHFGPVAFEVEEVDDDDLELAVVVDPAAPPSYDRTETFDVGAEETDVDLDPRWPGWLQLADGFAERLFATEEGDAGSALAYMNETLGVRGSCLMERTESGVALVVAAQGRVETEGSGTTFESGSDLTVIWVVEPPGPPLGLAIWGDFDGREESQPMLRLLVRLVGRLRRSNEPTPSRRRGAGGPTELVFPPGYLPAGSEAMSAVYQQIQAVVRRNLPVLILGETGVGKEKIAEILHASSERREAPLVAINCAAIPADLLEAELFGIGKRVATGVDPRPGKFQQAAGGTIFLDEIGEMLPALQAKLLRVLQEKQVQPVGGLPQPIDVRVVAATNADLEQRMTRGEFRRDLYYRLSGFVLEVPPLRACREDVPNLVEHFMRTFCAESGIRCRGVTVKALRRLTHCPWPGNVRELENVIRRLVYSSADGDVINAGKLLGRLPEGPSDTESVGAEALESLRLEVHSRELEIRLIREALRRAGGRQVRAAEMLGISRNGLADKLKRFGINPRDSLH